MTVGLRLMSACVMAGLCVGADSARSETTDLLRPAILDDETQTDTVESLAVVPSLTIALEEEQATLKAPRQITDPYAAQGIGQGGITLYPTLEAGSLYTSNVSRTSDSARSDLGLYLKPALRFESDWVRHSWEGSASGDLVAFLENNDLNSTQADAGSKFRLDIHRATRAEFEASYALDQEGTENSEVPATAIGNRSSHELQASAAIIHDFGPLEGRAKLSIERQIYEDVELAGGGTEDNSDRDNYMPTAGLRLSYIDPPALKPFMEVTYAPRFHDEKLDRNGLRRDSQGLTTSIGVMLDRGPIWQGEVALVYALRDYEDSALETNDAIGINGNLAWSATDLTTVLLALATTLNESSSATSSGTKSWSGGVDVTHELRENINLLGGLGVELEKGSGGTDTTITTSLGLEWQLNPGLAWTASYDGTWFDAAASGGNYDDQSLMTGIVLRR